MKTFKTVNTKYKQLISNGFQGFRSIPRKISYDLPSFSYKEVENEISIGKGGFGFVYKATYKSQTVVVKNISSQSAEDENLFLIEVKL